MASLRQRAADAGVTDRVTAVQADADEIPEVIEPESADLVLCHSVLEMIEDPELAIEALAGACAQGGAVSILVANRIAAVLSRALTGHFATALDLLVDVDGIADGKDTLKRRFETATLTALIGRSGLVTEQVHGVGVVGDLIPASAAEAEAGAGRSCGSSSWPRPRGSRSGTSPPRSTCWPASPYALRRSGEYGLAPRPSARRDRRLNP
ncbi:hypothetical protein GCM10029992_57710 [Glycomyces albus]